MENLKIRGARTHNLKNINLDLPRNKLTVITGLSGSGKSSLAFDTLYAEGQRRYVESLSAYARQFLQLMEKPDVDLIEGLSPAISIEQKATSHNPRSTVGTVTEIHDYLRLLYARAGTPHCPDHDLPLEAQSVSQMVDHVLALPAETKLMILAPVVANRKGEQLDLFAELKAQGFVRLRVDGKVHDIDALPKLAKTQKHSVDIVVDRLKVREDMRQRLAESFETALMHAEGRALAVEMDSGKEHLFSSKFACPVCNYALQELEPRLFSFNNPMGACSKCDGLGQIQFFDPARIVAYPHLSLSAGAIKGWDKRNQFYFQMLESLAAHYKFNTEQPFEKMPAATPTSCSTVLAKTRSSSATSTKRAPASTAPTPSRASSPTSNAATAKPIQPGGARGTVEVPQQQALPRMRRRPPATRGAPRLRRRQDHHRNQPPVADPLPRLLQPAATHRAQGPGRRKDPQGDHRAAVLPDQRRPRLPLARPLGRNALRRRGAAHPPGLADRLGPHRRHVRARRAQIGLHQRDNSRLLETLFHLRDLGNTVIVVEHDLEAIESADYVVDMGPGAGEHGGRVVAEGTPKQVAANTASVTGAFLAGRREIATPAKRTPPNALRELKVREASGNNLKHVDLAIPVGLLTCVTGVSGSGKSTLINDTLYAAAARHLYGSAVEPAPHREIEGLEFFDKVINVDQSPIGRTPRSNPATYTGLLTPIRELFAGVPGSRERGYSPGRFSFNVKGGRCEACQGDGMIKVEMHFLPDIFVPCDVCHGKRYNRETLEIRYKGKTIHEVLQMTVEQAREFFDAVPAVARKLQTLVDVGLSYIQLGQSATTLSGGEAQRVKLALELSKRDTGRTLYFLDEPTTGLHFQDIEMLLSVLHRLRDHGNTVVVIEHNLDVIKTADWIVDLGPEGGDGGGRIIVTGTPEDVARAKGSHTGRYLARFLAAHASSTPPAKPPRRRKAAG
jgi:excinuclease ABC subunit A